MMTSTPAKCPPIPQLRAYVLGRLTEHESDRLYDHVRECTACAAELETIDDGEDSLIADLRQPDQLSAFGEEPDCRLAVAKALGALASAGNGETPTDDIELPLRIGEYEIVRPLGRGGMGNVYLALHTKLGREVALKVLSTHRLAEPRMRQRFEAEMRAVGQLSHPNIVTAHDARDIDGTAVLVTEFIDGMDLGKHVQLGGPLAIADACEIVRKVAAALAYTHAQGFVHRDIKPSNIMLSRSGQVKLLDLGLARFQLSDSEQAEITGTGQTMGTADYVAPEQVTDSRSVDARADIYSLGCTLMKLLTGHAPFVGDQYATPFAKMTAHVSTPPPRLQSRLPQASKELSTLVDSMLQKDPDRRPQTPLGIAERLTTLASGSDLQALAQREVIAASVSAAASPSSTAPATKAFLARRVPISAAIAAGMFGVLFGLILGIIIKIKYPDGTTVEVSAPAGSEVVLTPATSSPDANTPAETAAAGTTLPQDSFEPLAFTVLLEESDLSAADLAAAKTNLAANSNGTWLPLAEGIEAPIVATFNDQRFALASNARNQRIGWTDLKGHILSAQVIGLGSDDIPLEMRFDEPLTALMKKVSGQNVNRSLAIVVNNVIRSTPRILSEIGGEVRLYGNFNHEVSRFIMQCVNGGLVNPLKKATSQSAATEDLIAGVWSVESTDPNDILNSESTIIYDSGRFFTFRDRQVTVIGTYQMNPENAAEIIMQAKFPTAVTTNHAFNFLRNGDLQLTRRWSSLDSQPFEQSTRKQETNSSPLLLKRVATIPNSPESAMQLVQTLGSELAASAMQIMQTRSMPLDALIEGISKTLTAVNATKTNNALKQLGIAFHNFHDTYHKFPGSKNVREGGRNASDDDPHPFSWRVAILPFIEESELFEQYRFDEPWDSEHNKQLLGKMPAIYRSPSAADDQPAGEANYMGFATAEGALGVGEGESMKSFTDGTSKTLLLVETSQSVPWTKPEDLSETTVQPFEGQPLRYATADGAVKSMQPIDNELLQKLITRGGGEKIDRQ